MWAASLGGSPGRMDAGVVPYSPCGPSLLSVWVPGPRLEACLLRGPEVVAVLLSTRPALGISLFNVLL